MSLPNFFSISTIFVIIAVLSSTSHACQPGSTDSLRQLKNIFGIVPTDDQNPWGDNGFEAKPITKTSDLDCDFEDIGTCRWKNYLNGTNDRVDTIDWYLFERVSRPKNWPVSIKPNGAKRAPAIGERFILAGWSRKPRDGADPKTIWYSQHMQCLQKENTVLNFDYWLFGKETKLRVIKLAKDTLKQLGEWNSSGKCTSKTPANGRCSVEIEQDGQPFHLGIQGYDYETGFTIIDNIKFVGSLGIQCGDNPCAVLR